VILPAAIQECEFRLRSQTRQTKKLDSIDITSRKLGVCAR